MPSSYTERPAGANAFNMDHQWLPFTANRHFKQEPRLSLIHI